MNKFDDSYWGIAVSDDQQLAESHWQEEEDRINLERLQDRLDRYVAVFAASSEYQGMDYNELVNLAMEAIKSVDYAAIREVHGR